jgi:hypothetical protein
MKRIENSIGESKAADGIQEESWWNIVIKEINLVSQKPDRILGYEEAPPMRLLALTIVLSAWIGWIMNEKGGHLNSWQKIEEAYNYGRQLSLDKEIP